MIYKPRESNKSNNLKHYSPDDIEHIKKELRDELLFFGYASDDENSSSYYKYESFSDSDKESLNKFETFNKETMKYVTEHKADVEKIQVELGKAEDVIPQSRLRPGMWNPPLFDLMDKIIIKK